MTTIGSLHSYSVKTKISVLYASNKDAVHIASLNLSKGWDWIEIVSISCLGMEQDSKFRIGPSSAFHEKVWVRFGCCMVCMWLNTMQYCYKELLNRSVENTLLSRFGMKLTKIWLKALAHSNDFHKDFSKINCCENRCPYKNCWKKCCGC